MRKKLSLILLLIFCCSTLSGCETLDKTIDTFKSAMVTDKLTDAMNSTMSASSAALGEKAIEAQLKVESQKASWNPLSWWKDDTCNPLTYKHLKAKADKKSKAFETALESDEIYQKNQLNYSLANALPSVTNQKTKKPIDTKLIILLVVIIAVVLLFVFLRKRSRPAPVKQKVEKTKEPEPYVPTEHNHNVTVGEDIKVNYERLLKQNCKKLGIDEAEMLAKYNGDARAAYEKTMLM